MLVGAKLLVHPVARRTAPQCGEDHAEAERDQPVAFHDAEELLTSEKIRFVQPYRETLVQFSPLHRRQAYLQRAFAECQSDIHHPFGQLGQLLFHLHPAAIGRDILPDGLIAAGVEQEAAHKAAFAVGDQAGELSGRAGEEQRQARAFDADQFVVRLAR